MRRALGDLEHQAQSGSRPSPDASRPRADTRAAERHTGDRPRQRFVQDGDVPVTMLHRTRPHEAESGNGGGTRLGAAEAALASERTARQRAERLLTELQATLHDLQTKWGHAELARQEAAGRSEAERAAFDAERASWQAREAALAEELASERAARLGAEAARKPGKRAIPSTPAAGAAQPLDEVRPAQPPAKKPTSARTQGATDAPKRGPGRPRLAGPKKAEPKPVKWWLSAAPKKK